jgi:hypothetical protein
MTTRRRFPAPWRAEKMPGGYVVRDANGQASPVCSRANEAEAMQAKVLTEDEARRIGEAAKTIEARGIISVYQTPANLRLAITRGAAPERWAARRSIRS